MNTMTYLIIGKAPPEPTRPTQAKHHAQDRRKTSRWLELKTHDETVQAWMEDRAFATEYDALKEEFTPNEVRHSM